MAVSPYFNHHYNTSEQDFFEDFIVESIKMAGLDIRYFPRTYNIDSILQEEYQSEFKTATIIEAYFHDVEQYGGEGSLMTKFGLKQMSEVSLSIAKKRWIESNIPERAERPMEGDIIYIPFSKSMFEIVYVEHEDPFWQLGKYNVFKLKCVLYTRDYGNKFTSPDNEFNTGAGAVNSAELTTAINDAVKTKSNILLDFTENNPFTNL